MKKIIALILAAMLCLVLAACGDNKVENSDDITIEEPGDSVGADEETDGSTEAPTEIDTEAPTEIDTEAPDESNTESAEESETPAEEQVIEFNKKWGGVGFEMPIPEPPFKYEIDIRTNGVKISTVSGGENGDVTHSKILSYCNTLKEVGYNVNVVENVIGERYGRTCYEFNASNKNGNSVELVDDGGGVVIFAYFDVGAAGKVEAEETAEDKTDAPSFDTSWASNEFEALLPKLPFDGWTTKQKSDSVYKMELGGLKDSVITDDSGNTVGYGEDKEALIAYLESLKDYGFSVTETGGIEGYEYEWLVVDPSGNEIEVTSAEGYCWITITEK